MTAVFRSGLWWDSPEEHSDALAAKRAADDDGEREPWEECGRCKGAAPHAWFAAVGDVCTLSPLYAKDWIRKPRTKGRKAA